MLIAWILQKPFVPLLRSRVTDKTPTKMTIAQQLKIKQFPFIVNDDQGNRVYWEESHGYWQKREFDNQGNGTYFQDSDGYWSKQEYDDRGNEVYYEDSDGNIIDNRVS